MENITILECNRRNAVVGTNSSFVNTFQQPVRVNPGDVVSIKTAIIDSTQSTGADIVLDADINLSLEMGYYYVNGKYPLGEDDEPPYNAYRNYYYNGNTTFSTASKQYIDWKSYVARNHTTKQCVRGTWTYTLKAGSYTAAELAEELTRAMTEADYPPTAANSTDDIMITSNPFNPTTTWTTNDSLDYGGYGTPRFYRQGEIDPTNNDGRAFGFSYTYPAFYGASMVALTWDRENNGRFSFDYLHTPLMYQGAPAILADVASSTDDGYYTDGHMAIQNRRSGVFFFSMEPKNFWEEQLGFDVDAMVVTEGIDGNALRLNKNIDELQSVCSTGQYVGIVNLVCDPVVHEQKNTDQASTAAKYSVGWIGEKGAVPYNYTSSDNTFGIQAKKTYDPTASGGYYLLSISGLRGDYHTDSSIRSDIQAIISRQYVQQGYITAFADSGVPWINTGPAFDISNLKIEILDPGTGKPATDIDENTAIFLQIARRGKINT